MTGDMVPAVVFIVQVAATLFMTGVIWFVQVVHYPLLGGVGAGGYPAYQREHERRTGRVVGPLMLAEAVTAGLLLWRRPAGVGAGVLWLGAGLLAVVWASTAFLQVPEHRRLGAGYDAGCHRRLVRTNWVRTAAWTARGVIALVVTRQAYGP
jgi:hypothetical protein